MMQYRPFGKKIDWQCSVLGFGTMRLPVFNNDPAQINEPLAIEMIHKGIDAGINYIDTAFIYHSGHSESLVGKALKSPYREKVKVATKLPPWELKEPADMDRVLNTQLERLDMPCVDLYLLHALSRDNWKKMKDFKALDWAERQLADGKIKHLGFSFHDSFDVFKEIVDAYPDWEFCQVISSYLDENNQAGVKGIQYAAEKGLGVVIMEPLRGGKLASPTPNVKNIWENAPVSRDPVEWALSWLWNQSDISVVLSGMSTPEQLESNLHYADVAQSGMLSIGELSLIEKARDTYSEAIKVQCTSCRYCMPCPEGVEINTLFEALNEASMFGNWEEQQKRYAGLKKRGKGVDACVYCHACEQLCPQRLEIPTLLETVREALDK